MENRAVIFLALVFIAAPASADTIFKCLRKDGTVDYRNFPCPVESETRTWWDSEEPLPSTSAVSDPLQTSPRFPRRRIYPTRA
jgi:hypothetical protein